ncbi:MAG TPA: phage tail length tape measure family protein, partial [Pirellulales bacterium]|nr:phage tail length tape measure family protein [Pirellulales bacterium]
MSVGGTLSVLVGATIAPLQKGLKQAEGVVHNFSGGVSKFLAGPGGIGGAIAGAIGGATVAAGLKIAVDRFKAVEDASTKAAAAITMTGGAAGVSLDQVQASAKALSQQTTIGTASAINMGTALLRSGQLGEGVFDEALTQSANMAAALGMEGPAAAEKLAAALKNPREGYLELAAAGVRFTEEQLKMIPALQAAGDKAGAQNIILQALNAQMGDAAKLA